MTSKTKKILAYFIIIIVLGTMFIPGAFILIKLLGFTEGIIVFLAPFVVVGLLILAFSLLDNE